MKDIVLTKHAIDTMADRHVTWDEVHDVLTNWQNRYASTYHRGRPTPDTFIYQSGTLAVVTHESEQTIAVKTVLLRESRQWDNDDARSRGGDHQQ